MRDVTTEDGREALAAARAAERLNRADMPRDRGGRDPSPPWLLALVRMFRPEQFDTEADESLLYDGDRPADLTDKEIAEAAAQSFEHRASRRTPEGQALAWREGIYYFGGGVRETHPMVHRALSGDETTGPTIGGCPWCKEETR